MVAPLQKVNGNYVNVNVASQQNDPNSILSFYKKAIALRKTDTIASAVLDTPFQLIAEDHEDIFAYVHHGVRHLMVISNFRSYEVVFKVDFRIKAVLLHNYPSMLKQGLSLRLRPFESYLLELEMPYQYG